MLTIIGAAIAFGGALWLFRRQLGHDREIFQDQLDAERSSRRAEMRRAAAYRLGKELIAASEEFGSLNNDELYSLLEQRDFEGIHGRSPGARRASDAFRHAEHELDLDKAVTMIWAAKLNWWQGVQALLSDQRLTVLSRDRMMHMLYNLVEDRFLAFDELLEDLGTSLVRWDGEGDVPTIPKEELPDRPFDRAARAASEALDKVLKEDAERRATRATR